MTTALVRANPLCVRCQRPVPAGLSVCLACGAGPLMQATRDGSFSVVLQPMAGARQRKEVAALCTTLLGGDAPDALEERLKEGNPPLWLTDGLTEEAATGLVARLKELHAPAKAVRGAPEAPSLAAAALNLWTGLLMLGAIGAGVATGLYWLIPVLAVAAFVAGGVIGRSRQASAPYLRPAWAASTSDPELEERARAAVSVRMKLEQRLQARYDRVSEALRDLLVRLSSEEDPVGFLAGGPGGALGRGAQALLGAATTVGERLALPSADKGRAAALEQELGTLERTATAVRDDLTALARDPDAEADLSGRLQRNVRALNEAAENARTLCA